MADKKPLVAGQSPAVVQQIGSSDTLDVPEIKLGTPLAAQYGGLGVDASLWANGKIPVFDGSQFAPGDPSGGSLPAGEKDQILVMGTSGPEWGGSFPLVDSWVPPLEFVGVYREWTYYTTSQAVFAMANEYGTPVPTYLTPINNGTPSYPDLDTNVRREWDTNPPEPWHEWQELAWPVAAPHFALGQSAYAGDNAIAVGQLANAVDNGTAIGQSANAGANATAVGQSAIARDNSIALGLSSNAVYNAAAIGQYAYAASGAVAVGQSASAGEESIAVGLSANAGVQAIAAGFQASASDVSIAIGPYAFADLGATALGLQASSTYFSIAIGAVSSSEGIGSTAIGTFAYAIHERAAILGAVDENTSYQPLTTADRRMTVDYQELEVINQGVGGQTAVILVDEVGGQWRITVNSSGVISASAV